MKTIIELPHQFADPYDGFYDFLSYCHSLYKQYCKQKFIIPSSEEVFKTTLFVNNMFMEELLDGDDLDYWEAFKYQYDTVNAELINYYIKELT